MACWYCSLAYAWSALAFVGMARAEAKNAPDKTSIIRLRAAVEEFFFLFFIISSIFMIADMAASKVLLILPAGSPGA